MNNHAVEGQFTLTFEVRPELLSVEGEKFARPVVSLSYTSKCDICRNVTISPWWYDALKLYLGVDELPFRVCGCSDDTYISPKEIQLSDVTGEE